MHNFVYYYRYHPKEEGTTNGESYMKQNSKTNIIWDLSGTLLKPSSAQLSVQEMADYSLVFYLWSGKKDPSTIDLLALSILNLLGEQSGNPSQIIRLHTGDAVPQIICSYVGGHLTADESWQYVQSALRQWISTDPPEKDQYSHIERVLKAFFTPEVIEECMAPMPESLALLKEVVQNQNNGLYILSNWDTESFDLTYKKFYTSLFCHFPQDHIVISGWAKALKPQPRIYDYLLNKCQLNPNSCFFIDDQEENIVAAKAWGIESALFRTQKIDELRSTLNAPGYFSVD